MPKSKPIIIQGGFVLTDPNSLLIDAAIVVQNSKIIAVGDTDTQKQSHPGAEIISFPDCLVMPGLINAHQHGRGLSQVQLGHHDDFLEPWIHGRRARGIIDGHAVTQLAAARMIANGVTTAVHANYTYGTGNYERELRDQIDAYKSIGIRHTMCVGAMDQGQIVYPPHEACFMAGLGEELQQWLSAPGAVPYCKDGPATVALMRRLQSDFGTDPLVAFCYGPAGPQWVSDQLWKTLADDARDNDLGLHLHALESPAQRDAAHELYPDGVFRHLQNLGALTDRTVVAHGVWADDADMEILAETKATVVRNPGCNIRMRNGIAPLARYLQHGVRMAIGTDNCSLQDDEDLLSELRLAGHLGREPDWNGAPAPQPADLAAMVTVNGAAAAQFAGEIGRLAPGYRADIAAFSLARTREPYLDPDMPLLEAFVTRATGADAEMTMVDGRILYRDGAYTDASIANLEAEAKQAAIAARKPAQAGTVNKAHALRHHINDHYRRHGPASS